MSVKVSSGQLEQALKSELEGFGQLAAHEMKAAVKAVAKTTVSDIKSKANVRSGKYKKSWSHKTTFEDDHKITVTAYSKNPHYRLTHLLENGHVVRNKKNGPVIGNAKPFVHIKPAEDALDKKLEAEIRKRLNNG